MEPHKGVLNGKMVQSRASTSKGNNHREMVVAEETLAKTGVNPMMKNETQLKKSQLTYQTSNELGDRNLNHKRKTVKHQQKCRKT
jgi:hypothetical protein